MATNLVRKPETVKEAVGIFSSIETLQAAIDDLQATGFMYHELSVLASDKAIEEKLGHTYRRVEEVENDPDAPRTVFVPKESLGNAEGALIGAPLYLAALGGAGAVVASGGTILAALLAAAGAGAIGAGVGTLLAAFLSQKHSDYISNQLDKGGLLLWVNLSSADKMQLAVDTLKKHSARDVHVHEIER